MARTKLLLANLAVTFALVALAALAGEAWLRAVPERNDATLQEDGSTKWRFNPYQPDGTLGYSHRPDWDTVDATDEFESAVHTNALGLRGAPASAEKAPGTFRVLVLGDSFAFGRGVQDDEAFPAVLGRALAPPSGFARVEVLNAGVSGWSADQEYLYLVTRGFALAPDLVVLAETENDPGDLAWNRRDLDAQRLPVRVQSTRRMIDGNGRMRYLDGGPLALPSLTFPGQHWLADHSQAYHWLRYHIAKLWFARAERQEASRRRAEAGGIPREPIEALGADDLSRALWSGTEFQLRYHRYLVAAIHRACAEHRVALATLLVIFRSGQTDREAADGLRADCAADSGCVVSTQLLEGSREDEVFFAQDGHWRPGGHERVGRGLAQWLEATQPAWGHRDGARSASAR